MSGLANDVRVAQDIIAQIADAGIDSEDPDFATLVESECDVLERLRRIIRAARHTDAQAKALAEMLADGRERKARLEKKADRLRGAALWALGELGQKRLEAPDFTATIGAGRPKVVITDADALPDDVCVLKREPSKTAIAEWLAEKPCPGAEFGNPTPSLTVRTR